MSTPNKVIKVLLVEDNQADVDLVTRLLAKNELTAGEQYDLFSVDELEASLDYLQDLHPDVILLDLNLLDSNGLDSLKQLQTVTKKVPIVILTGMATEATAIAAIQEGAQDYILKSEISSELLKRAIIYSIERQKSLEEQKQRQLRDFSQQQTDLICHFLPDRTITYVNEAFSDYYFKQSPSDSVGKNFLEQIPFENCSEVETLLDRLSVEVPTSSIISSTVTQDDTRWQQWYYRAIFKNSQIVEYRAIGRDITPLKQGEKEQNRIIATLNHSRELFKTLVDNTSALMWMSQTNGDCIFFNQAWLNYTGRSLETEKQRGWIDRIHPEDKQRCQYAYQFALNKKTGFQIEYRLLRFDHEYRWLFNNIVPRYEINTGKFAGLIGSCIDITQRKKAEQKLIQQAESNRILAKLIENIHSSLDLDTILQTTVQEVNQFLQAEKIFVAQVDDNGQLNILFESIASESTPSCNLVEIDQPLKIEFLKNYHKLTTGEIVAIDIIQKPDRIKSSLLIPILRERKLWGLLYAEPHTSTRRWKFAEIKLLDRIAIQLALAIKQSELYQQLEIANQELEQLATVDSLTNVANRRQFDRYLAKEWQRLAREKLPLSIILCDIDHFKLYNDTYGHQAGDRSLQMVAQAIDRASKRPADLVARYGGEEFAIILPNTTAEGAKYLAQQIRLQIQALQIPHINSPVDIYITLSLGVAGLIPDRNSAPEALIAAADKSLYEAKARGRNRVVKFDFE